MHIKVWIQQRLPLIAAWLTAVLYVGSMQIADPDLWGRLSVAVLTLQNGWKFPYQDVFSYTAPGALWIDHEWLTGFVFYPFLVDMGEPAFILLKYVLILAIFYSIFRLHQTVYRRSPVYALYGLILLLPIYMAGLHTTIRAQVFSFAFFSLFLFLLEGMRLGRLRTAWLWVLPFIGLLWGNLHGGFVMGVILLLLYALGAAVENRQFFSGWRYMAAAAGLMLLVGIVNPYGPKYLQFLLHAWSLDRQYVREWMPLQFGASKTWPTQLLILFSVSLGIVNLLIGGKAKKNESRPITPVFVLIWLVVMAVRAYRFQTFLAFGLIALLPALLCPTMLERIVPGKVRHFLQENRRSFERTVPALSIVMALIGMGYVGPNLWRVTLDDEMTVGPAAIRYPLGAIHYLQASPYRGNLMVRYGLGEFTYWMLYPRFKVSMDGRYEEVYSRTQFIRNFRFFDDLRVNPEVPKAMRDLQNSPAEFILTEFSMPTTPALMKNPQWRLLYSDAYYAVFGRETSLRRFPDYSPTGLSITTKNFTIEDTLGDFSRFKHS